MEQANAKYKREGDVLWFYRMRVGKRDGDVGLVGYYGEELIKSHGIVIARDVPGIKGVGKQFAWFPNIEDFIASVPKTDDDHYYEVIGATTTRQRPYFDIDINAASLPPDSTPSQYLSELISKIEDSIARIARRKYGAVVENNFLRYTSWYPVDGFTVYPSKYSFHIIVKTVCFTSSKNMREFGLDVKEDLGDMGRYIDDIWYSTRQFRMLGSTKLGVGAPKITLDEETPDDLASSLVTNTKGCLVLR